MNDLLGEEGGGKAPAGSNGSKPAIEPMRRVEPLVVSPSEDMALIAQRFEHRMPRFLRYLLDGLGTPDAQSADLMSYLLFDTAYTRTLVDVGYRDANERIDEIEHFLEAAGGLTHIKRKGRAPVKASRSQARPVKLRVAK